MGKVKQYTHIRQHISTELFFGSQGTVSEKILFTLEMLLVTVSEKYFTTFDNMLEVSA